MKFHIGKNNCLWWQFAELQDELHTVNEKRDNAQKDYRQFSDKTQEQLRMRFTDAAFGRLVVNVRFVLAAMLTEQKAGFDGEFMNSCGGWRDGVLNLINNAGLGRWRATESGRVG